MAIADTDRLVPDDLDNIEYKQLTIKHPDLEYWQGRLDDFRLLYRGGEEFLSAAGQLGRTRAKSNIDSAIVALSDRDTMSARQRRRRFLFQLEGEPDTSYISRWERAVYIGYIGAIIDYFRHWLFAQPPRIRTVSGDEPDWWPDFRDNADGSGKDFLNVARDVFLDVMVGRRAGWLIGTPPGIEAASAADDQLVLTPYSAPHILDWQRNSAGELEWVVLECSELRRQFPDQRLRYQTFTYADRQRWRSWEVVFNAGAGDPKLEVVGDGIHGLGVVPFVMMEIPHGLWVTNKLYSWQIDLFNQMSMLSNSQLLSCFLQPYFKGHDMEKAAQVLGDGVMMFLRSGSQQQEGEDFGWKVPPTGPLDHVAGALKEKRDEGYRIVHQMALAVDSQAIGAIARSGASKIEDRRATEIVLGAFGGYVREALLQTLDIASQVYGDGQKWTVDGFDNFEVSDFADEINTAGIVMSMMEQGGKPVSITAWKELWKDILGGRILNHVDEETRTKIRNEVDDAGDELEQEPEPPAPNERPIPGRTVPQAPGVAAPEAPKAPAAPQIPKLKTSETAV